MGINDYICFFFFEEMKKSTVKLYGMQRTEHGTTDALTSRYHGNIIKKEPELLPAHGA